MDAHLLSDIVTYSAQVACVVAIGGLLAAIVPIDAAAVRYLYWRSLLVLCLMLPWLQVRQTVPPILASASSTVGIAPSVVVETFVSGGKASFGIPWLSIVGWVLAIGVVLRLVRVGLGVWRLRRLRSAGEIATGCDAHEEAQTLVRAKAEIRYVDGGQPVTFGVLRPIVLLPSALQSQSADIQRVVLCHELFHVRRRDWLWVMGEEIVKAFLWFHPAAWWLISRVRLAREEVVDELTVLATGQRRAYIEALLAFADAPSHAPAAAFARRRHLFRRMVLISKEAVMSSKRVLLSFAAMAAVLVVGVWYAVTTFPLMQVVSAQGRSGGAPTAVDSDAGPVERRAKLVTPENPIPRRVFSVAPVFPSDASATTAMISVRLTLDEQGRVVEVRKLGPMLPNRRFADGRSPLFDAFFKAAIDAVKQWQYDPPASGPIAFNVTFAFGPDSGVRLVMHGAPVLEGVIGGVVPPPPPPPPPPGVGPVELPTDPAWLKAVRVGGAMPVPMKTKHVAPNYPPIAQSARVQGVVILELLIGPDGHVRDAHVLRSIPLLDQSAIEAARQWEFEPTLLNGAAVPVVITATVQFTLT